MLKVPFRSRKTHPRSDIASLVHGFRSKWLLILANRAREPERERLLPLNEPRPLFGRHISAIEKASYKLVGEGVVTMYARMAHAALGTPAAALKTTPAPPLTNFWWEHYMMRLTVHDTSTLMWNSPRISRWRL